MVTVVANWFGKGRKGFIMGVWNAHTAVGNIVGALIAGKLKIHAICLLVDKSVLFTLWQGCFFYYYFCFDLGAFVDHDWGLSFVVPGILIAVVGVFMWLFLVPRPEGMIFHLNAL